MTLSFINTVDRPSAPTLTTFLHGVLADPDALARVEIADRLISDSVLAPLELYQPAMSSTLLGGDSHGV